MTPNHLKTSTIKLVTLAVGILVSTGLLYSSFKWGVYYARNTDNEEVLSQDERGVTITEAQVKVMHGPDMVPYAIWHKDYLYTPDTAMMNLMGL
jgi:hypothetical protein